MATLMNHGSPAQSHAQMHPFFRPVPKSTDPASLQEMQYPRLSCLDGTFEQLTPDSHPAVSNTNKNPNQKIGSSKQDPHMTNQQPHIQTNAEPKEIVVDPNQDRRKRRKVTPQTELRQAEPSPKEDVASEIRFPDSLKVVAKNGVPPAIFDSAKADSHDVVASPNRRRSSRTSPAKSKEVTESGVISIKNVSPKTSKQANSNTSESKNSPQKQSPRRKMMQLTSGGKLFKSPNRKLPISQDRTTMTTSQSRNLGVKKGHIVPSLRITLAYGIDTGKRALMGKNIDEILNGQYLAVNKPQRGERSMDEKDHARVTHPFFLGKRTERVGSSLSVKTANASTNQNTDVDSGTLSNHPKPWSEIVFNKSKINQSREMPTLTAIWPPNNLHHLKPSEDNLVFSRPEARYERNPKCKDEKFQISISEDTLRSFSSNLFAKSLQLREINVPQRLLLSGQELCKQLDSERSALRTAFETFPAAMENIRNRAMTNLSAFDRGFAAGPASWPQEYAPKRSEEVLQPHMSILHDWLRKLKVHNVKSGKTDSDKRLHVKLPGKRKRRKRHLSEFDDFIASSDDESIRESVSVKNAILLCGPHGCGKTASVFAVAQELGFEVFEIHAGMRRSAKDIFDKVGDMTQNHLVQRSNIPSRQSSVLTDEIDSGSVQEDVTSGKQQMMNNFVTGKKTTSSTRGDISVTTTEAKTNIQKQSLILFEEVDNLFEDDKSFWLGVQSLTQQSKRPVILTCNSMDSIPVQEIDLHAILTYERQNVEVAVEYLCYLAASEGHLLERSHIKNLYLGKSCDLRATITELSLWCQTGVGSVTGGLDWIPWHGRELLRDSEGNQRRVISDGTFTEGIDLLPIMAERQDLTTYIQDSLGLGVLDLHDISAISSPQNKTNQSRLDSLDDCILIHDTRSFLDIADGDVGQYIDSSITTLFPDSTKSLDRKEIIGKVVLNDKISTLSRRSICNALAPITEDIRTFPPTSGRTAPSIDSCPLSVATEVAPYVRTIVSFDQRLEQYRHELTGGTGDKPARTTRAARAAIEGGSKATTRRERWFPKELNFNEVLQTGNDWPQHIGEMGSPESLDVPGSTQSTTEHVENI